MTPIRLLFLAFTLAQCSFAQAQTAPAQVGPAPPSPSPARQRVKLDGFDQSPRSAPSPEAAAAAQHNPILYAPHAGKAFSVEPVFFWGTPKPGQKVTFRLTALSGRTMYEVETAEDHVAYPREAASLIVGNTYRWTVVPSNDAGDPPQPALITLVSGDDRAAIEKELGRKDADANAVFVRHRIWYDAVAGYWSLLQQQPGDQDARKALATLYDQLPETQSLADAELQKTH